MIDMTRLGIDIGTTSIKCCLVVGSAAGSAIYHSKHVHNASIPTVDAGKHEQSTEMILDAVCKGLNKLLEQCHLNVLDVETVSICCQMHGVVLWNDVSDTSNLITWQDHRCDDQFVSHLRDHSSAPGCDLHTGYGSATLSWLAENTPEVIKRFKYCGTIADLFLYDLCSLDEAIISDHNAQSWGYFDDKTCSWDWAALKKSNVTNMPRIVKFGERVGSVVCERYMIGSGARVNIPIGDLQASVYAVLRNTPGRVFNYGTASQLVRTTKRPVVEPVLSPSVRRTLFTEAHDLLTAASLNGGNCLEVLFKLFNSCNRDNKQTMDYSKLMDLAFEKRNTSLRINPVFFGERHDTGTLGSFTNIGADNFTVGDIAAATMRGVIDNLANMMQDFRDAADTLYAVGIADRKVMQLFLTEIIGEFVLYEEDVTAAYGAVLFDINNER